MDFGTILLNRYKILEKIGTGGMSTVYLARDIKTGETVAVKVMDERLANDASYINRFEREADIGISLNHPNIAKVIARGKENGSYFIIIEYVQGITLLEYIKRNGKLPVNEAISIALQILSALSYAYANEIGRASCRERV